VCAPSQSAGELEAALDYVYSYAVDGTELPRSQRRSATAPNCPRAIDDVLRAAHSGTKLPPGSGRGHVVIAACRPAPCRHLVGVVEDGFGPGRVIHTRGITEVPGLHFLGLPWQHTRGSALLGFVADDAAHVAVHVARTAAAINSGQVPGPRGAPDAQAAPRHVRK
jgi:hypothetical protein